MLLSQLKYKNFKSITYSFLIHTHPGLFLLFLKIFSILTLMESNYKNISEMITKSFNQEFSFRHFEE